MVLVYKPSAFIFLNIKQKWNHVPWICQAFTMLSKTLHNPISRIYNYRSMEHLFKGMSGDACLSWKDFPLEQTLHLQWDNQPTAKYPLCDWRLS